MSKQGENWNGKTIPQQYYSQSGKAHRCVMLIECPHCNAQKGQLCVGPNGPKLETHYVRRHALNPKQNCLCAGCKPNPRISYTGILPVRYGIEGWLSVMRLDEGGVDMKPLKHEVYDTMTYRCYHGHHIMINRPYIRIVTPRNDIWAVCLVHAWIYERA